MKKLSRFGFLRGLSHRWLLCLILALFFSLALSSYPFANQFNIFQIKRMWIALVVFLPIFILLSFLTNRLVAPVWAELDRGLRIKIFFLSLAAAGLVFWLKPLPLADVPQNHSLSIQAMGQKQAKAKNSQVEIRSIHFLNDQAVPENSISKTPDWKVDNGVYYSTGSPVSKLEIQGNFPGGLVLDLRYFDEGGKVKITWDGVTQETDLYHSDSLTAPLILNGMDFWTLSPLYMGGVGSLSLSILISIFCLFFGLELVLYDRFARRFPDITKSIVLVGLSAIFIFQKLAYLKLDLGRTFRDSLSYVDSAVLPLTSFSFWAGTRPFTIPLFLKMLGTTLDNFQSPEQLQRIAQFQIGLSILGWGLLALSLAFAVRQRWLGVILFGLVCFFSLSPEISLWDSLLLSESLSYSFFAMMLAGWIFLLGGGLKRPGWVWISTLVLTFFTTLLYAFGRDSNIYFALAGAVILALACWLMPAYKHLRKWMGIYAALVILMVISQNLSLSMGNRWQVFIYDHLAGRILEDPRALQFFKDQGLPVNDDLLKITSMYGFQYQKLIREDPAYLPVKQWVDCCGKDTYFKYLLSDPGQTILEPITNASHLLNGDNLEYRSPRVDVVALPEKWIQLNSLFFNHQVWVLIGLMLPALLGLIGFLARPRNPLWLVIAVLLLSIYPLMVLVWYGDPLEVERHAAQIGVQLRLAGFISLFLFCFEELGQFKHPNL